MSEYYRQQAARIRASAAKAAVPGIRDELLKIAAAFERLAKRAEKARV
ncbi:MAG: hypothetical protein ACREEL_12035 [Stellaceae bacterium]